MIYDKPIIFNDLRKDLSLEYLKERYSLDKAFPSIVPKIIVVHWTGLPDLEGSFNIMNDPSLAEARKDIQKGGVLNVSAHYLVDRDGTVFKLLPDTVFARHVIGLNNYAIGIENVGNDQYPLTEAQLHSNIELIEMLHNNYDIEYLIGHYEYKSFIKHPLWLEKDDSYLTEKRDPGNEFMEQLRNALKNLNLSGPPETLK